MGDKMKLLIYTLTIVFTCLQLSAKEVKIDVDMDQLKTNVDNSLHNYNEYKKNLDIAKDNKEQTSKAIDNLKQQKKGSWKKQPKCR